MAKAHCVVCGVMVENLKAGFQYDSEGPPACEDHLLEAEAEWRKRIGVWPTGWIGGWMWYKLEWWSTARELDDDAARLS